MKKSRFTEEQITKTIKLRNPGKKQRIFAGCPLSSYLTHFKDLIIYSFQWKEQWALDGKAIGPADAVILHHCCVQFFKEIPESIVDLSVVVKRLVADLLKNVLWMIPIAASQLAFSLGV